MSELFSAENLTKRYGNVTVLHGVSIDVRPGEIHALLGANGAGKSTLCKLISGLIERTSGTMRLDKTPFAPTSKQAAERSGVQIVQQELNLIPTLSVAENLMLGRYPSFGGVIRSGELHSRARAALDRLALSEIDSHTLVGRLGIGRQQMVEIATALDRDCRLLLLDEPTAALSGQETEILFERLDELRRRGVGMIYISHRLDEVRRMADRISVLRDGRHVATEDARHISTDAMVEMMSGESTEDRTPSSTTQPIEGRPKQDAALVVRSLRSGIVRDVSFSVEKGERFGIAGLVGSGRTELLRAIFGADPPTGGSVSVAGRPPRQYLHPSQAIRDGLAMLTEDRKHTGLLLGESIRKNISLAALTDRFAAWGIVNDRAERKNAVEMCRVTNTRYEQVEQPVGTLSGGNQQKVAIAKWLTRDADVFLLDEPTRGIDVAARRQIYTLVDDLVRKGKGIVIVSSDSEELMEHCDRIAVLSAGKLVQIFERGRWSEDAIVEASFAEHRGANRGGQA